jgi:type IV pilus assembly protein PilM
MSLLTGVSSFFGLDIGTTSIRVVELTGGKTKSLSKYGYAPVDIKIAKSDAKADQQKLAQVVKKLIDDTKISTKNVAVGLPSQKVFSSVVDIDKLSNAELAKTMQFQADSLIPTPLAESKVDWVLLGDSPVDNTKFEVLISSVPNDFAEKRLDILEDIGLNVIAFEPDNFALTRSLLPTEAVAPYMIVDVGSISTDLVITLNGAPRLMRSVSTSIQGIVGAAMQNLNVDQAQAGQFVFKFGMSKDKLEGQVYSAITHVVDSFISEIDKSIKFFNKRYEGAQIERIVVTGGASAIPELPSYLADKTGLSVEIGNAWRNVSVPSSRMNELLATSNHFSVAVGLAERNE